MDKVKVSVIVPIYNAGIYLKKCLESLSNQTLKEIEIILVLDNPTDGSDKVAEEFALTDSRFFIIRNPYNQHIGNSRNNGLKIARGEYVAFCDHDDYVDPKMYETLYTHAINNKLDLVCSPAVIVNNSVKRQMANYPTLSSELLPFIIMKGAIGASSNNDDLKVFSSSGAIWSKLFKRSIIEEYQLSFVDTKKTTSEDIMFLIEFSYHCQLAGSVNEPLYYHVLEIGNTGATLSYHDSAKTINYLRYLYNFLYTNSLLSNTDIMQRFNNTVIISTLISINKEYKCHKSIPESWRIIKQLKKEPLIIRAFKDSKTCIFLHPTKIRKFLFFLFRTIICY